MKDYKKQNSRKGINYGEKNGMYGLVGNKNPRYIDFNGRDIDHIRTSELIQKGFKVLRLWECEIKILELDKFKNKINELGG